MTLLKLPSGARRGYLHPAYASTVETVFFDAWAARHLVPQGGTVFCYTLAGPASGKISGMKDRRLVPLCGVSDVAPGCALRAEHGGCAYAVFNVDGTIHVTQDECTHGPGSLAEGYVLDDEVECPFHQGRFHIPTGQATFAPATEPLKMWKVQVVEDKVCIDPAENES